MLLCSLVKDVEATACSSQETFCDGKCIHKNMVCKSEDTTTSKYF